MKIALCILMIFCLIVVGFAVLPGAAPDSYDHYYGVNGELANPVYDFSQTISDSVGFFQSIGNFFKTTFALFHPNPKPTGFMIRTGYFTGENGPGQFKIIMWCDAEQDLTTQLTTSNNFWKIYAYSGPDEFLEFFNEFQYYFRSGNPESTGWKFIKPSWTGNKLVGNYQSSLVPTPDYSTIGSRFPNFINFGDAERYNMDEFSLSFESWRLVGN